MKTLNQHILEEVELMEAAADLSDENINSIIKKHGKQHQIYNQHIAGGPGQTVHALGYKELKQHLKLGMSGSVHKKFSQHMDRAGFKSHWSHSTNEWVAEPKK